MPFVYFIRCGETGPIKIGNAKNVERRLECLQSGNHQKLTIIIKIYFKSKSRARSIESFFHGKFRKKRIRGEWFSGKIKINDIVDIVDGGKADDL